MTPARNYEGAAWLVLTMALFGLSDTEIPLAMLLGLVVFGERPTPATVVGTAIVVGAGLVIFIRERRLVRRGVVIP